MMIPFTSFSSVCSAVSLKNLLDSCQLSANFRFHFFPGSPFEKHMLLTSAIAFSSICFLFRFQVSERHLGRICACLSLYSLLVGQSQAFQVGERKEPDHQQVTIDLKTYTSNFLFQRLLIFKLYKINTHYSIFVLSCFKLNFVKRNTGIRTQITDAEVKRELDF